MSTLEAVILGIIQGLTEFLPISSSGHLELGQLLLGLKNLDHYVLFNLVCHLGTLLAIFLVFADQIRAVFKTDRTRLYQILLGTLPLFPLVLLIKPLKALFNQPQYLGFCFLFTALLLYAGIRFGSVVPDFSKRERHRWRDALFIGLFQAVAILPGVSRSGSTISGGLLLGWKQQEAITFSFLLAIPAILGATVIELWQVLKSSQTNLEIPLIGWVEYAAGFLTAFGVGYLALQFLIKLAAKNKFIYFVWYCLIIGIGTILYFNIGL
jgi:undecaprenyl-diphosphatase